MNSLIRISTYAIKKYFISRPFYLIKFVFKFL